MLSSRFVILPQAKLPKYKWFKCGLFCHMDLAMGSELKQKSLYIKPLCILNSGDARTKLLQFSYYNVKASS